MAKEKTQDKPIYGPSPVGPEYPFEYDPDTPESPVKILGRRLADVIRKPAHWIRQNVVEPNRGPKYYWYHRRYPRALPVDECYVDDQACLYEANQEFRRNFLVDRQTLELLRYRRDACAFWNLTTENRNFPSDKCQDLIDTFNREELNFFTKYGDMQYASTVVQAYMKQKNRMIMERRRALREKEGDLPEKQPKKSLMNKVSF